MISAAVQTPAVVRSAPAPRRTEAIVIRPLGEDELSLADTIFRTAFGTFIGLPDPSAFFQGREFVRPRWRVNPSATLGAECEGELIGSNLVSTWGSVGFFGPLTVRPDYWERGVAKRLLEGTMSILEAAGVRHAGLFTFADSPKHIGLYQKFGFWPRFLTAVMTRPVAGNSPARQVVRYSALAPDRQQEALDACRDLTQLPYDGLDLTGEIQAVQRHRLGETLMLWEGSQVRGFAVCHFGSGTEGGPEICYVKFAAARPGPDAGDMFQELLDACDSLAAEQGLPAIEAGVSLAREDAYRLMRARGFRTVIQGVAMHRPNEPGYHRPDAYVIDDWR